MNDAQQTLDGLSLSELQAGRRALYQAIMTGSLSVQYGDGSRVQYRTMDELKDAMRSVDIRIRAYLPASRDQSCAPIRAFRVRPWNGFR